jgi:Trk K+ transport system NAD-binding subunit
VVRRSLAWFGWRGLLFGLVFGCGLAGFLSGAEASERPGVSQAYLLTKIYYTLGLFVLGGMDIGTPIRGPLVGRALLWVAYFAAPAITASALIEGLLRVLQPEAWWLMRLRRHVVIGGCGRLALLYLQRLRELEPRRTAVVVDLRDDNALLDEARGAYRAHIVRGDISSPALLTRLRVKRAERVLLLTGDDFANLDAASRVLAAAPHLAGRIVVHVGNLRFMRSMAETHIAHDCIPFNGHEIAASHLVRTKLLAHFHATVPRDLVVLAGFGRFGHTVLDELQRRAAGKFHTVVIVDVDASLRARVFEEQIGFSDGYERKVVDSDLQDPGLWQRLDERYHFADCEPVFVIGSGDDGTNLRTALWLVSRFERAYVIARGFQQSSFAAEVAADAGFDMVSVAQLVRQSMPEDWFGGAGRTAGAERG